MSDVNRERPPKGWTRAMTARPRLTLLLALLFTALAVVAGSGVGDRLRGGGWEAPGSESAYAAEALDRYFPDAQPNLILLVDGRGAGVDSLEVAAEGRELGQPARGGQGRHRSHLVLDDRGADAAREGRPGGRDRRADRG